MNTLTPEGYGLVEQAARRHNVSTDAVMTLLRALNRGGGTQAQFSHSELGGMGQWSRGGMIMVGDMFNNGLKARVDSLCNDLSDMAYNNTLFLPETRNGGAAGGSWGGGNWWPAEFGSPSSSGSQNDMSYACFPDTRRLAIQRHGVVTLYDTGDHRIGGVSQQQSGSQDLTFTSQYGTIRLHELGLISNASPAPVPEPVYQAPAYQAPMPEPFGQPPAYKSAPSFSDPPFSNTVPPVMSSVPSFKSSEPALSEDDIFAKIERLHSLQQKGILSEAEFVEKKKELLARI